MGETDLIPPAAPVEDNSEEGNKPKKGFFSKVFGKKESNNKADSEEKELEIPTPDEPEKGSKDNSGIDEISKLIDDTINDIQKLQGSDTQKEEPKKEEKKLEPKLEEPKPMSESKPANIPADLVGETKPIVPKVEVKKEEPKPEIKEPAPLPKANPVDNLPIARPAPKKEVKKAPVQKKPEPKPVKKVAKAVKKAPDKKVTKKEPAKKFSLPAFDKSKEPAKNLAPKLPTNVDARIKQIEKQLKSETPVTANNAFVTLSGDKFTTLDGLYKALNTMSDATYNHHVTDNRNDFANWITSELKNPNLGKQVDSYFMRSDIKRVIEANLPKTLDAKTQAALKSELSKLKVMKAKHSEQERLSLPPQQFFKVDNKMIHDIRGLETAINKISSHEFSAYVSKNKQAFAKWLAYLTRDFQKEAKEIDTKYHNLVKKVLAEVNKKIDSKVEDSKKKITKWNKEMKTVQAQVDRLKKQKTEFLKEQKELTAKKKTLMAEVSKVKKEHEQVHKLKEKTKQEKDELHKDIAQAKASLEREKKEHQRVIAEAKATAKKDLASLSKQATGLKSKIQAEEAKIKKQWDKLADREKQIEKLDHESKKREEAVTKREDAFESEKQRIEKLVKHFEDREKQIELQKSELEVAGFQKYLDAKLKELHTEDVHDFTFDREVDKARNILKSGDVDSAKKMYLNLKNKFEAAPIAGSEKERVYNLLRELYDDIMLALSQ